METQRDKATIFLAARSAKTFRDRLFGMTVKKTPEALLFHSRFGLHTFGMRYPIDVLVLDEQGRVRKLRKRLPPKRFWFWSPRLYILVELPEGTIEEKNIELNSNIKLEIN